MPRSRFLGGVTARVLMEDVKSMPNVSAGTTSIFLLFALTMLGRERYRGSFNVNRHSLLPVIVEKGSLVLHQFLL
jgi:hypothetical protein